MRASIFFSVLAGVLAVAACNDDEPAPNESGNPSSDADSTTDAETDPADASDAAVPAQPPLPRYSVPVQGELAPYSFYPVSAAAGVIRRGTLKLEYPFPTTLSGTTAYIELEGPYQAGQTHVEVSAGIHGSGTCDLQNGVWICTESLPGIQVDREAAKNAMIRAGLSAAEVDLRLRVTDRFSIDPIGIFEIDASVVSDRGDDADDD